MSQSLPSHATEDVNTAVVIALTGVDRIYSIDPAYDASPTGGLISITRTTGGAVLYRSPIAAAGSGFRSFEGGLKVGGGGGVTITLAAAGESVKGYLNVIYSTSPS